MPQLDFSVFPSQLFWLSLSFFTLLFIMSKFIIPKTSEMINLRKDKIDNDLAKVSEIKEQIELAMAKYNKALSDATIRANTSLEKIREDLNVTISRRQEDLAKRLKDEIVAEEKKIALSKERAMQKIDSVSADLVIDIFTKLGFSGIKQKDVYDAMDALKKE